MYHIDLLLHHPHLLLLSSKASVKVCYPQHACIGNALGTKCFRTGDVQHGVQEQQSRASGTHPVRVSGSPRAEFTSEGEAWSLPALGQSHPDHV